MPSLEAEPFLLRSLAQGSQRHEVGIGQVLADGDGPVSSKYAPDFPETGLSIVYFPEHGHHVHEIEDAIGERQRDAVTNGQHDVGLR